MTRIISRTFVTAMILSFALPSGVLATAGPQGPGCGTYEVLKDETIAGQDFPKGTYLIHAMGVTCKQVLGKKGLFAQFLKLADGAKLPAPWTYLSGAIGAPKFSSGPGVGFRVQRISP